MTDREKILKAAKCCLTTDPCPDECPYLIENYGKSCGLVPFLIDIIAYLEEREQEPVRWIKISPAGIYECSGCGQNVMTGNIEAYKYCHGCGRKVLWDD